MSRHVVVGAGGIGRATSLALAEAGHEVVLASKSGVGRELPGVKRVAVDATDRRALTALAEGAASLVNAVNPPTYTHWDRDWPPMAATFLTAAQASGAGLVTIGNLYGYGPVDGPIHPGLPLAATGVKSRVRAQMWADALAAHQAGRVKATEVRASDYFGPDIQPQASVLQRFVFGPAAAGKAVRPFDGSPDAPHSWSYVPDIGAVAAALATSDLGWGRAWHVPSGMPRSLAQAAADAAAFAGHPAPSIRPVAPWVRGLLGTFVPVIRELDETAYQRERAFVIEAAETESTFGVTATPWQDALAATLTAMGVVPAVASSRV